MVVGQSATKGKPVGFPQRLRFENLLLGAPAQHPETDLLHTRHLSLEDDGTVRTGFDGLVLRPGLFLYLCNPPQQSVKGDSQKAILS